MWVELLVAGAISGSAFFHNGSDSGTSLISMAISTARIVSPKSTVSSPEHDITPELRAEDSEARDARLPKKALFSQVGRLTRSVPTVRHGGVAWAPVVC